MLAISLDGPKEIHDRCRLRKDGKGTFDKAVSNLRLIQDRYPHYFDRGVKFSVVLTPGIDISEVYEFFHSDDGLFRDRPLLISFVRPYSTTVFEELGSDTGLGMEKMEARFVAKAEEGTLASDYFLTELIGRHLAVVHRRRHWSGFPRYIHPNGICLPGRRRIVVEAEGGIGFCERVGTAQNIGNIRQGFDFDRIWNTVQQYIEISMPDCLQCWAIRLCTMCFAHAYEGEISNEAKRQACAGNRRNISADLRVYCQSLERNAHAFDFIGSTDAP
jgi:uncharacterized protein